MLRRIKAVVAILICVCVIAGGLTTISADSRDVYLYYNQLSDSSKSIYNAFKEITPTTRKISAEIDPITAPIRSEMQNHNAQVKIAKDMQSAIDAVLRDYPEIFWIKLGENGTYFNIGYTENLYNQTITYDEVEVVIVVQDYYKNTLTQEFEALWEKVRNFEVEGEDREEKVKSIHDALCSNITYKETDYCYDVIGALNYDEAVCEGISEAFKMICDYNDIPCITVSGMGVTGGGAGGSGPHMWNYVQMEDGRWYALDATWDLGPRHTVLYDYFLVGSDTESEEYGDTFGQSHLDDGDFSGAGVMEFEYPPLSKHKYEKGLYPIQPTTTTQIPTTTPPIPTTASAPTTTTGVGYVPTNPTENTTNPIINTFAPIKTASPDLIQDKTTAQDNPQVIILYAVKSVKVKGGKRKATVTFKKIKGVKEYVVKYSYKKNMKGAKTKTVKSTKATLKKLKSGKRVYVRVCAKVGTIKGKYSKRVSAKVK